MICGRQHRPRHPRADHRYLRWKPVKVISPLALGLGFVLMRLALTVKPDHHALVHATEREGDW